MNRPDFTKHLESLQKIETTLNQSKGPAYAGSDDALANFKRIGERLGIDPVQVGVVYLMKHVDSLVSYAAGNRTDTEPLEMRVVDIRLYSALISALVMDKKKEDGLRRELETNQ